MSLKDKVSEFIAIAKDCPENLQSKCFELLLKDYLEKQGLPPHTSPKHPEVKKDDEKKDNSSDENQKKNNDKQEDFQEKDLHVKTKKFLQANGLSISNINQIFYKEGENILPLFDDLKTTKISECQTRIALLQSLQNAIHTGEFEFDGEKVREECNLRKCYDPNNFAAYFKNSAALFDNFEKYDKKQPAIRLNADGKKALAQTINDLQ
ncbi:MAG: hypothetical protein ABR969_02025 [Sedimentisphaerales bacterium]|jgi:DNA-binding transcriptional MerR regulator